MVSRLNTPGVEPEPDHRSRNPMAAVILWPVLLAAPMLMDAISWAVWGATYGRQSLSPVRSALPHLKAIEEEGLLQRFLGYGRTPQAALLPRSVLRLRACSRMWDIRGLGAEWLQSIW